MNALLISEFIVLSWLAIVYHLLPVKMRLLLLKNAKLISWLLADIDFWIHQIWFVWKLALDVSFARWLSDVLFILRNLLIYRTWGCLIECLLVVIRNQRLLLSIWLVFLLDWLLFIFINFLCWKPYYVALLLRFASIFLFIHFIIWIFYDLQIRFC